MSDVVVFRPHVHEADGRVVTPDYVLASAAAVVGGVRIAFPVERLSFPATLAESIDSVTVHPALAVVASTGGALVVPAALHRDSRAGGDLALAIGACSQPLARSAMRLAAVGADGMLIAGGSNHTLAQLADRAPRLRALLAGAAPDAESVLLFPVPEPLPPAAHVEVAIEVDGARVALTYARRALEAA